MQIARHSQFTVALTRLRRSFAKQPRVSPIYMTSTDETVQLVSYHDPISDQTTLVASKVDQISFCSRHALIPMYFH